MMACGVAPLGVVGSVNIKEHVASAQCPLSERQPAITIIENEAAWSRQLGRLRSTATPSAVDIGAARTPQPVDQATIDWQASRILILSMGQQPSAGYQISLARQTAAIENGVLRLAVNWMEPPPDSLQAQIITHPCLAVEVPRRGYQRIDVLDQQSRLRLRLELTD